MSDGIKRKLKKFFFPVDLTCNVCGREIFDGYFCDDCYNALPFNDKAVCGHCGRKVPYFVEYCDSCSGRETYFDKARSRYDYDGSAVKMITDLKYEGKRYLAEIFAKDIAEVYYANGEDFDFVLFVPMSKERKAARGYDHAELIAEEFSRETGVPLLREAIVKTRETTQQMKLSFSERQENLKGSFLLAKRKEVAGKRILLLDDVMTTGATAENVCKLLKKAGALRVVVLTVASVQKKRY